MNSIAIGNYRRSRPRKKPRPSAPVQLVVEDIEQYEKIVGQFWNEAGPSVTDPTPDELRALTLEVMACQAVGIDEQKERSDAAARAAIKTLINWCERDPSENGLPHVLVPDRRLIILRDALKLAEPLAEAPPGRPWLYRAWGLWSKLKRITTARNEGNPGVSPSSHAVIFISSALKWVGYPRATPDAVSAALRENADFRESV